MEYKTYKTVDEQIEYLKENKKIIIPPEYKHIFIEQNYISIINSYKEFFAFGTSGPKNQHVYNKETPIEKVLEIYEFDNWLSKYFYDLIGCFEKRFKNILIQEICSLYNENCDENKPDKYCISYVQDIYDFIVEFEKIENLEEDKILNLQSLPRFCKNICYSLYQEKYNFNLNVLDSRISLLKKIYILGGGKSLELDEDIDVKNILIRHYIKTQNLTPLWVIPNALSFGELTILFSIVSGCSQKRVIAKFFNYNDVDSIRIRDIQSFSGYLEVIRRIRNVVNHYEPLIPFLINNVQNKKIEESHVIKAIQSLVLIKSISKSHHFENLIEFPEIKDTGYNNRKLRILQNIYEVLKTK